MAELRDHVNHLQQENDRLRTRLESNRGENSRGLTHPAPPISGIRAKTPSCQAKVIPQQTMNYLPAAPRSLTVRYPRIMWTLSPERGPCAGPADLSAACTAGYEEKSAKTGAIRNWPLNICLCGLRVWLLSSRLFIFLLGRPRSRI